MKNLILSIGLAFSMLLTGCGSDSSTSEKPNKVNTPSDKTFMMLKNRTEGEETVSDLYVKYYGADEQKVTTGVEKYPYMRYINGEQSLLVLDSENNLYKHTKDGEKHKIGSDILAEGLEYSNAYEISESNNTIAYLTSDYSLYAVFSDKDKVKVASNVGYYKISEDGKYIYYLDNEGSLYSFDSAEEKEKIKSDVSSFVTFNNGQGIIFNTTSQELYKKSVNEEEAQKIDDGFISSESIQVQGEDITYLNEYDYDGGKGELFIYNSKNGKIKIASDVMHYIKVKDDFYYINSENNFYKKNLKDDKSEKISSDVIYIYNVDGKIYYLNKDNDLYLNDNKESKKIGTGIEYYYDVNIVDGKDVVFKNKDGEIFLNEEKIISEVKSYIIDEDTLAYVKENNEVHVYDLKNKKDEVVLQSAKSYSSIYYSGKFLFENTLTPADLQGAWKYEDNYGGYAIYNFKGNNKIDVYTEAGLEKTYNYEVSSSNLDYLSIETTDESDYISINKLDDKTIKLSIGSSEVVLVKTDDNSINNMKKDDSSKEESEIESNIDEESSVENGDIKASIAEFIEEYEYAYVDAVNDGDVYLVSDYLVYNGKLYKEHSENIPSYYEKGISETLHGVDVKKIEKINDKEYRVTVKEKIGIIKSGEEEIKEFNSTYVVINNDGYFKIREMM